MTQGPLLRVSVAFAYADRHTVLSTDVPEGTTLREAIRRSGMLDKHPEIDLDAMRVGVFGKLRDADAPVRQGERIEIYRPLKADPKEARRARALKGKTN